MRLFFFIFLFILTNSSFALEVFSSGRGVVKAKPDIAYINFSVVSSAKNAASARSQNATSMNKVIKKIKSLGFSKSDYETTGYRINEKRRYQKGQSTIVGYETRNSIKLKIHPIKRLGSTLDHIITEGANQFSGISYDHTKRESFELAALKQATQNAKFKAQQIAKALGKKIKTIKEVHEGTRRVIRPHGIMEAKSMRLASDVSTPIQAGELSFQAQVEMVSLAK